MKKSIVVLSILVAVSLLANGILFALYYQAHNPVEQSALEYSPMDRYVLYVGISDKDTREEKLTVDEAALLVSRICFKHTESFTYVVAKGAWLSDENTQFFENTLIYYFYDVDEATINAIVDEVLSALNQESVLLERQKVDTVFYP